MRRSTGLRATRWGLVGIGVTAVACTACCVLPFIAVGGFVAGGIALLADSCFTPIWIVFGVVGVAASVLWVVRALNKSACGDDTGCGCAPEPEADVAQPDGGQLQL
jgi:hypothetical protein